MKCDAQRIGSRDFLDITVMNDSTVEKLTIDEVLADDMIDAGGHIMTWMIVGQYLHPKQKTSA